MTDTTSKPEIEKAEAEYVKAQAELKRARAKAKKAKDQLDAETARTTAHLERELGRMVLRRAKLEVTEFEFGRFAKLLNENKDGIRSCSTSQLPPKEALTRYYRWRENGGQ